ncbi:hypothetical protein B0H10DRAFT_691136 [Mycena sp. CBHHK59/15]|nr:hypothetical protein B0H10DRAFT_691136 [Mycena sp. CBHHK59/15]
MHTAVLAVAPFFSTKSSCLPRAPPPPPSPRPRRHPSFTLALGASSSRAANSACLILSSLLPRLVPVSVNVFRLPNVSPSTTSRSRNTPRAPPCAPFHARPPPSPRPSRLWALVQQRDSRLRGRQCRARLHHRHRRQVCLPQLHSCGMRDVRVDVHGRQPPVRGPSRECVAAAASPSAYRFHPILSLAPAPPLSVLILPPLSLILRRPRPVPVSGQHSPSSPFPHSPLSSPMSFIGGLGLDAI